jgi:hypothetical protein
VTAESDHDEVRANALALARAAVALDMPLILTISLEDHAQGHRCRRYRVQVIADAGGSMTKPADDITLRRMENADALVPTS